VALSDPQSITIDGTAISLPRVYTGTKQGSFVSADGKTRLIVDPTSTKTRNRKAIRLYQDKVTADPLVSTTNVRVGDMISLIIDRPLEGYSDAEIEKQVVGLLNALTASTNALLKKIIAGEN
jgi:hypothetical protein